jgi:hypothetical protein
VADDLHCGYWKKTMVLMDANTNCDQCNCLANQEKSCVAKTRKKTRSCLWLTVGVIFNRQPTVLTTECRWWTLATESIKRKIKRKKEWTSHQSSVGVIPVDSLIRRINIWLFKTNSYSRWEHYKFKKINQTWTNWIKKVEIRLRIAGLPWSFWSPRSIWSKRNIFLI